MRLAAFVEQDVCGFDVAMGQSPAVGIVQGLGHGGDQLRRLSVRRATLGDAVLRSVPGMYLETT